MPPIRLRLLLAFLIFPLAAHGTVVTTTADEYNGTLGGGTGISLREAVKHSPVGDTITFAPALSGQTIRLTLGQITIARSLIVDGSSLPDRIILSGDKTGNGRTPDDARVFQIITGTVVLDSVVITGGNCPTGTPIPQGGGILVDSTTTHLTIRNSAMISNHAGSGGGIYFSGLLNSPDSFLLVQHSTFTANTANAGGALYGREATARIEYSHFAGNSVAFDGGAIWTRFNLNISNSTLSGNTAAKKGGGIYQFRNTLIVERTTLSANTASQSGGGMLISVNNQLLQGDSVIVKNSTLAGNTADNLASIGPGAAGGAIDSEADSHVLSILHTTVSGNFANGVGGGIRNFKSFNLDSSIVAGNGDSPGANISGTFTGSNNLTSGALLLAPLGDYGGLTHTMPPLPGSPAINAGGTTTLTTDQRGFPRDSQLDIGAVEYQGTSDLTRFWKLDFDGDGSPYGTEQALGTDPLVADPANSRNITAPALNASGHAVLNFGIGAASSGTRWILRRSTDLLTFTEIYRYSGSMDTAVPGVTFLRTATGVTVTDTNPLPGGGFYRFEAVLQP